MKKILFITVLLVSGCPKESYDSSGGPYRYYYKIIFTEGNQCTCPLFIKLNDMKIIYENYIGTSEIDFIGVDIKSYLNQSDCSLVMFWDSYNSDPEKLPVEIYVRSLVTNSEAYFEGELDVLDSSIVEECILKDDNWTGKALSLCFESLPENAVIELRQESLIDWEDVYEESCTDYVSGQ